MTVTITHACGCERSIEVKGIRESKQYQNWLATKECPDCHVSPELAKELEQLADEAEATQTTSEQFKSSWSGKEYTRWLRNGRMVGCSCGWKQHHLFTECKHQTQYNSQREAITGVDLAAHVEDDLRKDAERTAYNYYELSLGII